MLDNGRLNSEFYRLLMRGRLLVSTAWWNDHMTPEEREAARQRYEVLMEELTNRKLAGEFEK